MHEGFSAVRDIVVYNLAALWSRAYDSFISSLHFHYKGLLMSLYLTFRIKHECLPIVWFVLTRGIICMPKQHWHCAFSFSRPDGENKRFEHNDSDHRGSLSFLISELGWLIDAFIRMLLAKGQFSDFKVQRVGTGKEILLFGWIFPGVTQFRGKQFRLWTLRRFIMLHSHRDIWTRVEREREKTGLINSEHYEMTEPFCPLLVVCVCGREREGESVQTRNIYSRWIQERLG